MANSFIYGKIKSCQQCFIDWLHRIKCKLGQDDKKCETCGIIYKYYDYFLEYTNFIDTLIEYKGLRCNKIYQRKLYEK